MGEFWSGGLGVVGCYLGYLGGWVGGGLEIIVIGFVFEEGFRWVVWVRRLKIIFRFEILGRSGGLCGCFEWGIFCVGEGEVLF